MEAIYHVRIKKEYAAAVIEDLEKMEAIELFEPEAGYGEQLKIPDRQKEETLRRLTEYKANPSIAIPWEEVEAELKADEDDGQV